MEQIINSLLSPVWWITVVIGTILLHIIAIRIDAAIPWMMEKISTRRLRISEIRQNRSDARIELMRVKPLTIHYFVHQANFYHHQALLYLIMTITAIIVVVTYLDPMTYHSVYVSILLTTMYMVVALCFLLNVFAHSKAFEIGKDIHAALMDGK